MPRIERQAAVVWEGNLARGEGTLTAASTGAFSELPFSLPSRIAVTQGKTSPEELLAAAHGGCITMSVAGELTGAGFPPERLDVTVTIVMDEVGDKGHLVVGSEVDVRARVDGIGAEAFAAILETADAACPLSTLIRASASVTVRAHLESS